MAGTIERKTAPKVSCRTDQFPRSLKIQRSTVPVSRVYAFSMVRGVLCHQDISTCAAKKARNEHRRYLIGQW